MTHVLRRERTGAQRPLTLSPSRCLDIRSGSDIAGDSRVGLTCAAPPSSLALTGTRWPLSLLLASDGMRVQRCCEVVASTQSARGTRRCRGESTSIRVWCSDVGAPA